MRAARRRGFDVDTNGSIGYLLRDTSRRILRKTAALLEPHGISLPQYFVLRELWQVEGLTQREIADRVGVLEPTIVATIDALEAAGYVARSRSAEDRRKTNVLLTPAGHDLRARALGYAALVLDEALAGVPDADVETLRATLQRIKANFASD